MQDQKTQSSLVCINSSNKQSENEIMKNSIDTSMKRIKHLRIYLVKWRYKTCTGTYK
jgi:hypothetical protein